jgi:hypothetical protein
MIHSYNERRNHQFLNNFNIDKSRSAMRLTARASIFLPLSLAASMLSMQIRISNL